MMLKQQLNKLVEGSVVKCKCGHDAVVTPKTDTVRIQYCSVCSVMRVRTPYVKPSKSAKVFAKSTCKQVNCYSVPKSSD